MNDFAVRVGSDELSTHRTPPIVAVEAKGNRERFLEESRQEAQAMTPPFQSPFCREASVKSATIDTIGPTGNGSDRLQRNDGIFITTVF